MNFCSFSFETNFCAVRFIQLKKKFPDESFIELPRKHMLYNLSSETIQARQIMLETFLEDILSKPLVRNSDEFVIFLSPSDRIISPSQRKVTKLKQPEHLKKQADERRKTKKKQSKRWKERRTSTLEDIFSKMGAAGSFEDLLPSQPTSSAPQSPFVEVELQASGSQLVQSAPSVGTERPVPQRKIANSVDTPSDTPNDTPSDTLQCPATENNAPNSPVRIIRRTGRGRGRGRGKGQHIPRPASPRVIRLRPPPIAEDSKTKNFMESLNRTIGRNTITEAPKMVPINNQTYSSCVDLNTGTSVARNRAGTYIPRDICESAPAVDTKPPVPPRSSRSQIREPRMKVDKRRSHSLTRSK